METKHQGSCHCGAVTFEVVVDASKGSRCNCTVCMKIAGTTTAVKPSAFTLLAGETNLAMYEWGGKTGQRYFCKTCGVHAFGRGHLEEMGGDYVSIPLNCLDDVDLVEIAIGHWDGRNNNWHAGQRAIPWPLEKAATA
jgi:hypothetical protein